MAQEDTIVSEALVAKQNRQINWWLVINTSIL
jgi:hypothetical protein